MVNFATRTLLRWVNKAAVPFE